jgi:cyclic beta-1,2-glucan synthetase
MKLPSAEALLKYGENRAKSFNIQFIISSEQIIHSINKNLKKIRKAYIKVTDFSNNLRTTPTEIEWFCDNRYMAEREGKLAAGSLYGVKGLTADGSRRPYILGLAGEFLELTSNRLSIDEIESFLTGVQSQRSLSERELWLFPTMLTVSLIDSLARFAEELTASLSEYPAGLQESVSPSEKSLSLSSRVESIITSIRFLYSTDLTKLLLRLSQVESALMLDPAGIYESMDDSSRSSYRHEVSMLAEKHKISEKSVTDRVLELAAAAEGNAARHVGCYIFRKPLGAEKRRIKGAVYFTAFALLTALMFALVISSGGIWLALLALLPLSEVAKKVCDYFALKITSPVRLPRLSFAEGLPEEGRTLCVISALLTKESDGKKYAQLLENYYHSNPNAGENLLFGILPDLRESDGEVSQDDAEILSGAEREIARLNERYGGGFFLFSRPRKFNPSEKKYMPWERKRGALCQLVDLISGKNGSLRVCSGDLARIKGVKYVITLDADTKPSIESLTELVSTMLHPLNRPEYDEKHEAVTNGHAILQPRVSIHLEDAGKSFFSRVYAGYGGADPYSAVCSDLYQDLFDHGSFSGKGIFEVEAFSSCLSGKLPENRILSHDLLEGSYLRCGFVSDIEFFDGFPAKINSWFSRLHRWIRGDWQLLPWLTKKAAGGGLENPISALAKWKIADNMRRSLLPVFTLLTLLYSFFFFPNSLFTALAIVFIPPAFSLAISVVKRSHGLIRYHSSLIHGVAGSFLQFVFQIMLLPHSAYVSVTAICASLWRMFVSKKRLLMWVTSAESEASAKGTLFSYYRLMYFSPLLSVALLFSGSRYALLFSLLWALAPLISYSASGICEEKAPSEETKEFLLDQSKKMWRYFSEFLNKENNYLPPDNYQEHPAPTLATRTSPTNIGLALLSCLSAADMKIITKEKLLETSAGILDACEKLEKWNGHLINWYDTTTLKPLHPRYISAVDSGNFLGALIVFKEGLRELGLSEADRLMTQVGGLINNMDFLPLYDKEKRLFRIGYDLDSESPTEGWYDLLASEARITSYICIANGSINKKHWRQLGRSLTEKDGYRGLCAWTGSMFEYFMPNLIMPSYPDSLLSESLEFCVYCQMKRGKDAKSPWGISESSFFAFDRELNYRYKAHGVSNLAMKRGMDSELVISPYSSFLALEAAPGYAVKNLKLLSGMGMEGKYGMYEAVDYTPARQSGTEYKIVKSFMSHHIGMSIISCDNCLNGGIMQKRFMANQKMRAYSELLCERIPMDRIVLETHSRELPKKLGRSSDEYHMSLNNCDPLYPRCHLLSGSGYSLVMTDGGLSRSTYDGELVYRFDGNKLDGINGIYFFLKTDSEFISLTPAPYSGNKGLYTSDFSSKNIVISGAFENVSSKVITSLSERERAETREIHLSSKERPVKGELVCYLEPVLAKSEDYYSHPSFSKLFIESAIDDNSVTFHRRSRDGGSGRTLVFLCSDENVHFDTSRELALGRGGFANIEASLSRASSSSEGAVLDPCLLARVPVSLEPGEDITVGFSLASSVSGSRAYSAAMSALTQPAGDTSRLSADASALDINNKGISGAFDMLADILFVTPNRELQREYIEKNRRGQNSLWKYGVSGDIPIIAAVCAAAASQEHILELVKQHKLLSLCGVHCDLVFLCEDGGDYRSPSVSAISDALKRTSGDGSLGSISGVHAIETSDSDERCLILACANVLYDLKSGSTEPLRRSRPLYPTGELKAERASTAERDITYEDMKVNFQTGGKPPSSAWSNVLCNRDFGYIATDSGSGYMWYKNARENRINSWTNDALCLKGSERITVLLGEYEVSVFSANDGFECKVTHAVGFSSWEKALPGGVLKTTAFVCADKPARIVTVEYTGRERLMLRYFSDVVLGDKADKSRFVVTRLEDGVIYADNHYNRSFPGQTAVFAASGGFDSFTCSKDDAETGGMSRFTGGGYLPCVCYESELGSKTVILNGIITGDADKSAVLSLVNREAADSELEKAVSYWQSLCGCVSISTPSEPLNRYINGWAMYQTIACRMFARSSLYQSGGAYGFRDQLQDSCAAIYADSKIAREQILLAAGHQFEEGDVQHWWHEDITGGGADKGVRTRCSDDLLWLCYAVCEYTEVTGDCGILSESVGYLSSPPLGAEHERYETPSRSPLTESLYLHCIRAAERVISRGEGEHGLSLIGGGDWNDGFNLVGADGKGESVWLTWFFCHTLERFSKICTANNDETRAARYLEKAAELRKAAEGAWDGNWYKRGYYDNGAVLGSCMSDECTIDSIAQSFSAVAGSDRARSEQAINSAIDALVDPTHRMVKLFTPPFKNSTENPGYIKGYLSGVRENGGQYTHAAIWLAMGCFELGMTDRGMEILEYLLPSTHSEEIYKVEPYVLAADVYSAENHAGRGGWSWYTGSSSWYFRVAVQSLLGMRLQRGQLMLSPQLPSSWDGFSAEVRFGASHWMIKVKRGGQRRLIVDGKDMEYGSPVEGGIHKVELTMDFPAKPN